VIRKGGWSGVRFCCITRAVPRQSVRQTSDNDGSRKEREDGTGWLRVGPIGLVIPSPAATSRDSISGGGLMKGMLDLPFFPKQLEVFYQKTLDAQ